MLKIIEREGHGYYNGKFGAIFSRKLPQETLVVLCP